MRTLEDVLGDERVAYWTGVRDAQLGQNASNERARLSRVAHYASYALGRFHVSHGIVPRYPVAAVHRGPTFRSAENTTDMTTWWSSASGDGH